MRRALRAVFAERRRARVGLRTCCCSDQRTAVEVHAQRRPRARCRPIEHGRQQVDQRAGFRRHPVHDARPGHHERYPHRVIQRRHLVPETAFAEHVAVIAGENHDRVVEEFRLLERPDDLADLAVDIGGICEVGPARIRDLLVGH